MIVLPPVHIAFTSTGKSTQQLLACGGFAVGRFDSMYTLMHSVIDLEIEEEQSSVIDQML